MLLGDHGAGLESILRKPISGVLRKLFVLRLLFFKSEIGPLLISFDFDVDGLIASLSPHSLPCLFFLLLPLFELFLAHLYFFGSVVEYGDLELARMHRQLIPYLRIRKRVGVCRYLRAVLVGVALLVVFVFGVLIIIGCRDIALEKEAFLVVVGNTLSNRIKIELFSTTSIIW